MSSLNPPTSSSSMLAALAEQLSEVRTLDRHGLQRRWQALQRRAQAHQPIERGLAELQQAIEASRQAVARGARIYLGSNIRRSCRSAHAGRRSSR